MLAALAEEPFDSNEWLFEIKWDGYRAIAEIENRQVNLYSRELNSFNKKYPSIVSSLNSVENDMVIDGEIVVLNNEGKSDFQLLQSYGNTGKGNIVYYVLDILFYDGKDLTNLPLSGRKEILKNILPDMQNIRYNDHIIKEGKAFYRLAEEKGLEGIMAKKLSSKYLINRRSNEWLKLKIKKRQEAIIAGYTKPKGSRGYFGSLVLGVYDHNNELIYIGQAGGGFTEDDLENIYEKLQLIKRNTSPFKTEPKTNTPAAWVKPELICEVEFGEWTQEGLMRQPVFLGLREDKISEDVRKELPEVKSNDKNNMTLKRENKNNTSFKISNPDKVYWPKDGYKKEDLIDYYRDISKYILPYLKDRPESLLRHPDGINGESFFQKDITQLNADWLNTKNIFSGSQDKRIKYLICNDEKTLIYMANLGCIEINPWFSRIENLDNPDYLVIDLDPFEIEFDKVVETALAVKEVFDEAGTDSYCKTSGATGLHIYVPLGAKYDYDTAVKFAHIIAKLAHSRLPQITSLERSPSKRPKKVYLDYLQNRKGQTLAAPYSVRPRPGAPVSTPLDWTEVKTGLNPVDYNIKTIFKRLERKGDIFKKVLGKGIDIKKCLAKLQK